MNRLSLTYYYSAADSTIDPLINRESIEKFCIENDVIFVDICIDDYEELRNRYVNQTPVIIVGPYVLNFPFSESDLEVATNSAKERFYRNLEADKNRPTVTISRLDRISLFISKYYAALISVFFILFLSFPFLAPVLKETGHDSSANVIYKTYRILCHQLVFRSFFLFGDQLYYPRELAGFEGITTYEEATGMSISDIEFARTFTGNEIMGYKVALCERDIAIYGSLAIFGIIFMISNRKIKGLPWYIWFVIALLPIAIDGFSQIPGLSSGWPEWVPIRESTPLLRIITGTLFGAGTAWYMYPLMEDSLKDTRITLIRKMAVVKKIEESTQMEKNEKK